MGCLSIDLHTLYGIRRDGTSRRISMFPPSYSDRACIRNATRRALVKRGVGPTAAAGFAAAAVSADAIAPAIETAEVARKVAAPAVAVAPVSAGAQTDVTFCAHACGAHKRVAEAWSVGKGCEIESGGGEGAKKGERGKEGTKEKNGEGKGKKGQQGKAKEGKESGKKGKSGQKESTRKIDSDDDNDGDSDDSNPDSDGEFVISKGTSRTKQGKTNQHKKPQQSEQDNEPKNTNKPDAAEYSWTAPPMAYPWDTYLPTFPTPYNGKHWTEHRQALNQSAKLAHEAMQAAKRADEDTAARWITEQQLMAQQNALHWLQTKYTPNYGRAPDLAYSNVNPSSFGYNPAAEHPEPFDSRHGAGAGRKQKHVSFADTNLRGSRSAPELGPHHWQRSTDPVVVYEENNRMYTADGHEVVLISKNPVHSSMPMEGSAQDLREQRNEGQRMPLQQKSGNNGYHGSYQPKPGTRRSQGDWKNNSHHPTRGGQYDHGKQTSNNYQVWASGAIDGNTGNSNGSNAGSNNGSHQDGGCGSNGRNSNSHDHGQTDQNQNQNQNPEWNTENNQTDQLGWPSNDNNQNSQSGWPSNDNNDNSGNNGWPNTSENMIDKSSNQWQGGNKGKSSSRRPNSPTQPTWGGSGNGNGNGHGQSFGPPNSPVNQNYDGSGNDENQNSSGWVDPNDNQNIQW